MNTESRQSDLQRLNRETQDLWERKAPFWDERMGEGNQFQRVLVGPASERLLEVRPGEVVLDLACGNGVMSRRLAQLGATVVATDFSSTLLERARARTTEHADRVEYVLADATDETQLLALGEGRFDAVVCNMALHDIADIAPLMRALPRLLKPTGRFVFSVPHPAFNFPLGAKLALEEEDYEGDVVEVRYVKVSNYLCVPPVKGAGMPGEPAPHYYFHRPLHVLLRACFESGFVLDGLEEPAFGQECEAGRPLGWANFKDIPPVFVARLRPAGWRQGREKEHGDAGAD
ncbi:MAG: class I SAM-dependent methyltransferase [Chloroflexota bacterium]|nr:class I SAM-dependent methyltransferase [Chloroflexota bacterium]